MLATDMDNTQFVGASRPDDALWAEFFDDTVLQPYLSEREGRPIYHDVVKIKIKTPGNDTNIIVRPMEPMDKVRFPRQWMFYESKVTDGRQPGTPLSELPGLTKAVIENLRVAGFHTVEQGAAASDASLQGLKMAVGMDPQAFRLRCQSFLGAAEQNAPLTQMSAELEKRDAQIEALTAQMKLLTEMLEKATAPKEAPKEEAKPATLGLSKKPPPAEG